MRTLQPREVLTVFCIIDREGQDPLWKRAGVARVNSDNSLNVKLHGVPANPRHRLQVRLSEKKGEKGAEKKGEKKGEKGAEKKKAEPAFLAGTQEKTRLNAFTVIDRQGKDSLWMNLGCAFVNADGSMNLKLDMYPVNGELCVRLPKPDDEAKQDDGDDEIPF